MRKCIRCGNQMKEGGAIKIEGSMYPIIVFDTANKMFKGRMGTPLVAICPNCGEISFYVKEPEKVKME